MEDIFSIQNIVNLVRTYFECAWVKIIQLNKATFQSNTNRTRKRFSKTLAVHVAMMRLHSENGCFHYISQNHSSMTTLIY